MCFGNTQTGETVTNENQTGSKSMSPWLDQAAQQNLQFAQGVQNTPVTPYNYQRVAENTPAQTQAMGSIQNLLGSYASSPDITAAQSMFNTAGNAGPSTVTAPQVGAQPGVAPQSVLSNLSSYMSPYTQQALDPTIRAIQLAGQQARTGAGGIDSQATSAGAYGDSRNGVELAQNYKDTNQQVSDATAQAYDRAFTQGSQLSQFDKTADLNAQQFNATQNLQRLLQNAGLNMQGQMANGQFSEQALSRMLGAGGQLASLGSNLTGQGATLAGLLSQMGGQAQGVNQSGLDAAYQEFLRQQNDPMLKSQVGNAALGISTPASGYSTTGTSNKDATTYAPNNSGLALGGSLLGSLLGPSSTTGGALGASLLLSDRRAKDDIVKVGKLDNGLPIYSYTYKADPSKTTHIGVMAQEAEKKNPDSVHMILGTKYVDYDLATAA